MDLFSSHDIDTGSQWPVDFFSSHDVDPEETMASGFFSCHEPDGVQRRQMLELLSHLKLLGLLTNQSMMKRGTKKGSEMFG